MRRGPAATSSSRSASPAAPSRVLPRHRRSPAAGRNWPATPSGRAKMDFKTGFMTAGSAQEVPRPGAVRWWLIAVALLIAVMVLVGGATRLTESGLSIVEWKPVTGTLPPLNQNQWIDAFEAYQKIPQYRELNAGMNLGEF